MEEVIDSWKEWARAIDYIIKKGEILTVWKARTYQDQIMLDGSDARCTIYR